MIERNARAIWNVVEDFRWLAHLETEGDTAYRHKLRFLRYFRGKLSSKLTF